MQDSTQQEQDVTVAGRDRVFAEEARRAEGEE
jgi:hypothetical protein